MPFEPHDFDPSEESSEESNHEQARRHESEIHFQDLWLTAWLDFHQEIKWSVKNIVYDKSEDIMQHAYEKMIKHHREGKFPEGLTISQVKWWLLKTAKNAALDEIRKKENQAVSIDAHRENQDGEAIETDLCDPNIEDFADTLANKDHCQRIYKGLGKKDQRLLELRFQKGLSNGEIAMMLKKTPNQIRVEIHRALKKAREILHKIEGETSE